MRWQFFVAIILLTTIAIMLSWQVTSSRHTSNSVSSASSQNLPARPDASETPEGVDIPSAHLSETKSYPSVPFRDGASVRVWIRPKAQEQHPQPNELMTNYPYFRSLAQDGNPEVSVKLWKAMKTCDLLAPADEATLETAIDRMYQTHTLTVFGGSREIDLSGETDFHEAAEGLRALSRNCWGVPEADRVEAYGWLDVAAESGYLPAVEEILSSKKGTAEHFELVLESWRLGRIGALQDLFVVYRTGSFGVEPDPVAAYAYSYLHSNITILDLSANGGKRSQQRIAGRHRFIEAQEARLRDHQIEAGQALAREILKANPNCCVSAQNP